MTLTHDGTVHNARIIGGSMTEPETHVVEIHEDVPPRMKIAVWAIDNGADTPPEVHRAAVNALTRYLMGETDE